ncbi:MAG: PHP domain-containing protein, partial [Bdellovibrionales bacterium]|nr:PHP domain-containing protein [Bdellovibrionales bacterium]
MRDYYELQCRSHFSFLEGASHPEELVRAAIALGLPGIAMTDRNGVYGLPKAFDAQKEAPGFRLISGSEVSLCDFPSVTMLAETKSGYGWMCRMLSQAHAQKDKTNAYLRFEELLEYASHPRGQELTYLVNVPLSVGTRRILKAPESALQKTAGLAWDMNHFMAEGLQKKLGLLKECASGKVYVPMHRCLDGLDHQRWEVAQELRRTLGVKLVATNDVHYHEEGRAKLQNVLTCIRKGVRLKEAGFHLFQNSERYLKCAQEMALLFKDAPELLKETVQIAERCTFTLKELRYRYPSEWIPSGFTAQSYLENLTWKGAEWRYPGGVPEKVSQQLNHELQLIAKLEFADYFLTIWEIVQYAREKKILCQGRGSAANSIVCFCLAITAIDPVQM